MIIISKLYVCNLYEIHQKYIIIISIRDYSNNVKIRTKLLKISLFVKFNSNHKGFFKH